MNSQPLKSLTKRVKVALKDGQFTDTLLTDVNALKALVEEKKEVLGAQDPLTYFQVKCMIYEVRDYFNLVDTGESQDVSEEGAVVLHNLPAKVGPSISRGERQLIREKVRFCLAHANELYRANHYETAREKTLGLYNFVLKELSDETLPCYGTLAQLTYFLGKVHRQMAEYNKAEKYFADSIEHYYRRAERRGEPAEYKFCNYKAAVSLGLGIGWVNFTRGSLTQALYKVAAARLTLSNTGDSVRKAYLDLIYGSIKRSQAGLNKTGLQEAIEIISRSFHVFQEREHKRYLARAAFELALAYNLTGEAEEAERKIEIVEQVATERHDHRWQAHALVVRSRVQRNTGRYAEALESAEIAFKKAEIDRQMMCMIDALIARGEAKLALQAFGSARDDFEVALRLNESRTHNALRTTESVNPKIYAVCHLYIARSYALEGNERSAKEAFQKWDKGGTIEHTWVHHLSESVKADVDNLGRSFFIKASEDLNYKQRLSELRKWLLEQAELKEPSNLSKRAKLLGITRARLSQLVNYKTSQHPDDKR